MAKTPAPKTRTAKKIALPPESKPAPPGAPAPVAPSPAPEPDVPPVDAPPAAPPPPTIEELEARIAADQALLVQMCQERDHQPYPKMVKGHIFQTKEAHDAAGPEYAVEPEK